MEEQDAAQRQETPTGDAPAEPVEQEQRITERPAHPPAPEQPPVSEPEPAEEPPAREPAPSSEGEPDDGAEVD